MNINWTEWLQNAMPEYSNDENNASMLSSKILERENGGNDGWSG